MAKKPKKREHPELKPSDLIRKLPAAIADEATAVAFLERQRWGSTPACAHCDSLDVYPTKDVNGHRNKQYMWRCRSCGKLYTVRIGTIFEHSHIPLRHWCYAFWRSCSSKKGVSALEIKRHCQISYRAALFMLHRIRWGMAHATNGLDKLNEVVEADETYVGGKPRHNKGKNKRGRGTLKAPVFAVVQRHGPVRVRVVASISGASLKEVLKEFVHPTANVVTDELSSYIGLEKLFDTHDSVVHSAKEYSRPWPDAPKAARGENLHTNTIEGFFSIVKRGINGIYHAVSKRHLHRYMAEFEWRYNVRMLNDGDRTAAAIQASVGSRLLYREPIGSAPST